jgi:hypothetical protein
MINNLRPAFVVLTVLLTALTAAGQNKTADLLQKIRTVGKEGKGSVEASKAVKELTSMGPAALLDVLAALDDANPIAANYLRAAAETITDRALAAKKKLPAKELEAFILDIKHVGSARKLAFDLLVRIEPMTENKLLPGMLDDPGAELRRAAVQRVLDQAQKLFDAKDDKAQASYQKALLHARDRDQVQLIAKQLKTLGTKIDLTKHFGFITQWQIIGPFESSGGIGFHKVYAPETKIDLTAVHPGKDNKDIKWQKHIAETKPGEMDVNALGVVDLNKVVGPLHGTVAYGYTVVHAKQEMPVEIRVGSNNAIQIFLNGKKIFSREEYHHGTEMDQHIGKGILKAGANEVLIKVCQNEQTDSWAQLWSFQLRITDALGAPVPITVGLDKSAVNN